MRPSSHSPAVLALLVFCSTLVAPARAQEDAVRAAMVAYIQSSPKDDAAAARKISDLCRGDLALIDRIIRSWKPLTVGHPGKPTAVKFKSRGQEWSYTVRVPNSYDGRKRFPVLVLPDHAAVDSAAGINFWLGDPASEKCVLFRPEISKYKEDTTRFPDQQFFAVDAAMAEVMHDAMVHLRLNFAVDPAAFIMTGLSQAGYYTWYYAASFPDDFAAIIPESSGGMGLRAAVLPLARNLSGLDVRILHAKGDQICPFADAQAMFDALQPLTTRKLELIAYEDADYGSDLFPDRHPGPHGLRLKNVLAWVEGHRREIPRTFTRVIRYRQQGHEGAWDIKPPADPMKAFTVTCTEMNGKVSCTAAGCTFLPPIADVVAGKVWEINGQHIGPKIDPAGAIIVFKKTGDPARVPGSQISVTPTRNPGTHPPGK